MGSLQKLAVGIVMLIFSVSWDGTQSGARPIYKLIKLLLCKDPGGSQPYYAQHSNNNINFPPFKSVRQPNTIGSLVSVAIGLVGSSKYPKLTGEESNKRPLQVVIR